VEQPNGHFGDTVVRQMFFSAFALDRYTFLARQTVNADVAGIAAKAVKELHYHWEHAAQWVIRLGDGTPESHQKVQDSVDHLWAYTGELFMPDDVDTACAEAGLMPDLHELQGTWRDKVVACLERATLRVPEEGWSHRGGKQGVHSEHLSYMLAEMQVLPRTYPDATW
jgi:ring-1,2-phenylacetyl-CoA epoxidase subunit PaaC